MIIPKAFRIDALRVDNTSFTISATTLTKNKIELRIDADFRVVSASRNGEPVLLLSDGRRSSPLTILPREISVPSENGDVKVIKGGSSFGYASKDGVNHETMIRAVVNPKTGGVWFGSTECGLAVFGGQITGVEIDSRTWELPIYREFGRIPLDGDTAAAFQNLTRDYCSALAAGTLEAAARIPLTELPDLRVVEQPAFGLRKVDVRDSQLRVLIHPPWAGKFLELRLDESLALVSAKLRPAGSD
jgi:hypothetical protein